MTPTPRTTARQAATPLAAQLRLLGLWRDLLRLSWHRVPGIVVTQISGQTLQIVFGAGAAIGMRDAVNASLRGETRTAVITACLAALASTAYLACASVLGGTMVLACDKVALHDLHPRIHRDIATLEGLEHLEDTEYLDRLTLVRTCGWSLVMGLWSGIRVLFTVLQLAVMLALLGAVSPWLLSLLLFASVPLWFERHGKKGVVRAELDTAEQHRLQRHLFGLATDPSAGKELRVAGAGAEIARRQRAAWDEATGARFRAQVRAACWKLTGWALFTAGFGGALGLVVYRAAHGHGTVGDIVLSVTVATSLRQALYATVAQSGEAAGARRLVEPYLWLRDYAAADRARSHGTLPTPAGLADGITFDEVCYTYPGAGRPALDRVSVRIPAGSVVAMVGEYGSGKTTLVKLLGKFYRPTAGTIRVDGADLAELETAGWRARSAAAYQDFGRFQTRFAGNVGLGDLPHLDDRPRICRAVRDANAQALVERLPDGLDTELGTARGGVDLSEGQWQKAALARASMREDPLLFVLDEPTASLDAPSEQEIFQRHMARARELAGRTGAVTVIVSHRFSTVAGADLILVLDGGRLIESGTHAQLAAIPGGRYADLYGIQASAYAAPL